MPSGRQYPTDAAHSQRNNFLLTWFNLGTVVTILLIVPSMLMLLNNLSNYEHKAIFGVTAANIPNSVRVETQKQSSSDSQRFSFEVMLPGLTVPISEVGYYIFALLVCSLVHEAGHAIAAVQEGM